MSAQRINGTVIAKEYRASLLPRIQRLKDNYIIPGLAVVLVGNDPASQVYVGRKTKTCEELGIHSEQYNLEESCTQQELLDLIQTLNQKPTIHGILVQLPLPPHLDSQQVIDTISPKKDVDAFHPVNLGKLTLGTPTFLPCTPAGIMELLRHENIDISGKECVILGRSNIVGKPISLLLLQAGGTVTICHSKTKNLAEHCRRADLLVAAIGKAKFVTADMVKKGAVVIDVGINRDEENKLCGDVDFESVAHKASYITPVPGGVGPMTITMLIENTITAAEETMA